MTAHDKAMVISTIMIALAVSWVPLSAALLYFGIELGVPPLVGASYTLLFFSLALTVGANVLIRRSR